ncbi:MAG TPA: polyribonucleotide nucleotidyltransferase [bacterium]|nr:polyribonucleotide nucleotidyltransferase [bacterium]
MQGNKVFETQIEIGGKNLLISTGRLAKQAGGAIFMQYGESAVLVTATRSNKDKDLGYFPLSVDFEEKMYAAGKIPGGFIKRESRPTDNAIINARKVDRSVRPLFPKGFKKEVQIVCTVMSSDMVNTLDVIGITGASAALCISDIPFSGPIAGVRIGRIDGQFIINPTFEEQDNCDMNIIVAGARDTIMMVEGKGSEISEEDFLEALNVALPEIAKQIDVQEKMIEAVGKEKMVFEEQTVDEELTAKVMEFAKAALEEAMDGKDKKDREALIDDILEKAIAEFATENEEVDSKKASDVAAAIGDLEKKTMRDIIINKSIRADGRKLDEIRPISCDTSLLPRTHGSALFTRGQTQVLSTVTLGAIRDAQRLDDIYSIETKKSYIHHYNFPPYSVGETRMMRGPSRRDIGHGTLAENALAGMIPSNDDFPYAIRAVSEVLESNGSSSMASVCGSTMALMDAGVPVKRPIAGIAMGLVIEDGNAHILTDIQGLEDHLGDMDFKVAGSKEGITAVQMDIKVKGITSEIMKEAMEKARVARLFILDKMLDTISEPRKELSPFAPRTLMLHIAVDKIGTVIGPGGKTIREIVEKTGAEIDIEDDGRIIIYAVDQEAGENAKKEIELLTKEVEVDEVYTGKVVRILSFGAFVQLLPGTDGLVHISQICESRINKVEDVLSIGQEVTVRVRDIDDMGRINLTMKGQDNPGVVVPEGSDQPPERSRAPYDRDKGRGNDRNNRRRS